MTERDLHTESQRSSSVAAEDGWSAPRIYGNPLPVPGDASSLAVATAQQVDAPVESWSVPTYHGPRRHRPRTEAATPAAEVIAASDVETIAPTSHAEPGRNAEPTTGEPTTAEPTTGEPTTGEPTTGEPAIAAAGAELEVDHEAQVVAESEAAEADEPSLLASSRTMAIASLASRATGFVRNIAIAAAVGAGLHSVGDAYGLANTLPNMVYELLLGGVLTSVIIPVLVKAQQDDRDHGLAYTQRLLSIATTGLAITTLLAVLGAPWLIGIFGGPAQFQSVASLWATLLLPEIFFYGLGAMFAAVLNSRHVFGWPAWAPVLNNVITIAAAVLFVLVPGPRNLTTGTITNTQILVLGIGTTLGIAAQALILVVPLRRTGFVWKWRFRASANEAGRMAEFRTLTLWVLGYVVISQVGVYVINRAALSHGAVQIFANADLLFQVPYGIVGVSLLTALMPRMSRAAARGETSEVLADLRLGTRLSAVALVPIAVGMIALGPAFTSVILLGRYSESDARLTGYALAAGAFGLLPFALVMLQQRVFYAMRDARTPTLINLAMVATKIGLVGLAVLALHGDALVIALTVSTSLSYVAGSVTGHLLLTRRFGRLGFKPVVRTVGLISIAAVAGGAAALLVVLIGNGVLGISRVSALIELIIGGALGVVVFSVVAMRLKLPEVEEIVAAIRRR